MLKILILGFPRTGTTILYTWLRDRLRSYLAVFEPMNPEQVVLHAVRNRSLHDVIGEVESDFSSLPLDTRFIIAVNSHWYYDWLLLERPTTPWCGWYWEEILERLDIWREQILLKDVCLWTEIDKIAERYRHATVLVTVRDPDSVLDSLRQWHTPRRTLRDMATKLTQTAPGTLMCKILRQICAEKLTPALKIAKVYGKKLGAPPPAPPYTWRRLRRTLEETYSRYLQHIEERANQKNIKIIRYRDKLTPDIAEDILREMKREIPKKRAGT